MKTKAAVLLCVVTFAAGVTGEVEDSIQVKVLGLIRTDVAAIGGEATGATITAKGITWELDFKKSAALRKAAEKLNGKKGIIQGTLESRKGVEIKERWIVTVTGVEGVGDAGVGGIVRPRVLATARRDDTRVAVTEERDVTVLDIVCPFGIDQAVIERTGAEWPLETRVRLHLRGLESFQVSAGGVTVEWSAAADSASRVSLRRGPQETPLGKSSPYFSEARFISTAASDPKQNAYFEVPLPPKLMAGSPQRITLAWVDFYRG